jgi:hypothetical protein
VVAIATRRYGLIQRITRKVGQQQVVATLRGAVHLPQRLAAMRLTTGADHGLHSREVLEMVIDMRCTQSFYDPFLALHYDALMTTMGGVHAFTPHCRGHASMPLSRDSQSK